MKIRTTLLACVLVLVGVGCASAPTTRYSNAKEFFPKIEAGKGRVYFYRTSGMAAILRPNIRLNDEVVGEAIVGQYFYRDLAPGRYTVLTKTEVANDVTFDLKAGEEKYVRFGVSMGFLVGHVYPEVVPLREALDDLEKVRYAGRGADEIEKRAEAKRSLASKK